MELQLLGEPCRNFCFLGSLAVRDNGDGGKEKIVFSSFAAGETGVLLLIDPENGEGESIILPADSGAWALVLQDENTLLVGTCAEYGYLHVFDIPSRTFSASYRTDSETYIWNLVKASDGRVYGGTYNGCVLVRYDHAKKELTNLGRLSDDPGNLYSRNVYPDDRGDGNIMIQCGYASPCCVIYNIYAEKIVASLPGSLSGITHDEVKVENTVYSRIDFTETSVGDEAFISPVPVLTLSDGTPFSPSGQEYYLEKDGLKEYHDFKVLPPPTGILAFAAGEDGALWGGSGFGQTIFRFDPVTGSYMNTKNVCTGGGEVYGMRVSDGKVYCTSYAGGDTTVYDPLMPWDQRGNKNPITAASCGSAGLIRPTGFSTIGPDGKLWTGWQSSYGTYGGGITRFDKLTYEQKIWHNIVSDQCIDALSSSEQYLYFTTGNSANGLRSREGAIHLACIDTECTVQRDIIYPENEYPCKPVFFSGKVYVPVRGDNPRVDVYSEILEMIENYIFEDPVHSLYVLPVTGALFAVCTKSCVIIGKDGVLIRQVHDSGIGGRIIITRDEKLYLASGSKIYNIIL